MNGFVLQAAHGWLEAEQQGEADDIEVNDSVKLAFPEWVSRVAALRPATIYMTAAVPAHLFCAQCTGKQLQTLTLCHAQIHHTAWKGKGDVYHLVFDVTQFIYGRQLGHFIRHCYSAEAGSALPLHLDTTYDMNCASAGRVWPEEDKGEVELLLMLISHVCGAYARVGTALAFLLLNPTSFTK